MNSAPHTGTKMSYVIMRVCKRDTIRNQKTTLFALLKVTS